MPPLTSLHVKYATYLAIWSHLALMHIPSSRPLLPSSVDYQAVVVLAPILLHVQ